MSESDPMDALGWPEARLAEALEAAARHVGIPTAKGADAVPVWGASELEEAAFDRWVEASAAWLGIEAEPIGVEHADVESTLSRAAPALVRVPPRGTVLVLVGRAGRRVTILTPDLEPRRVTIEDLRNHLCAAIEGPVKAAIDGWLGGLLGERQRDRVREAMLRETLRKQRITRCYLVRVPPSASFWAQLRFEGVFSRIALLLGVHAAQYVLGLGAWYTLGSGAFGGGIDRDWLLAWALLLISAVPIQLFSIWTQSEILLSIGTLLKRRLLVGTLRIEQDLLRREGAGQLLGRALEASSLEALALSGGLFAVLALVEVGILAFVLATGPGGVWQLLAFAAWAGLTLGMGWRAFSASRRWTSARRDIVSDMVEQMVGHRTRLAQQRPSRWHDGEDEGLDRYLGLSTTMDRQEALLRAMPQGWYLVGLATLLPTIVKGDSSAGSLAVAVGGMLLGAGALTRLTSGLSQVGAAVTAWREVDPLFRAAAEPVVSPSPGFVASHLLGARLAPAGGGEPPVDLAQVGHQAALDVPVLDATDLVFGYQGRPQPVLREGSLKIHLGDRVLLEGPSGGGKSTLASLLAGLRRPQSGLLLLEGLDWQTVGPEGWRRRVAGAPQFHDNHVLSETFLFNLLMGRRWPPEPEDIAAAEEVCRELGLGDLLLRMPAGLMQMVGETGWRLSHGEQSRLFIARALLQDAKVIVLDESFGALDPGTVQQCLRCVLQRAPALVVIAHP